MRIGDDGSDERVRPADTLAGGIEGQAHRLVVAEYLTRTRQAQGTGGGHAGEVPVLGGGVVRIVVRQVHAGGKGCRQVARVFGNVTLGQGTRRRLGFVLAVDGDHSV